MRRAEEASIVRLRTHFGRVQDVWPSWTRADGSEASPEHDVEGLIAALADPDGDVRAKAADVLAPLADPRAEQPLLRALADPDGDVRANAACALGELQSEAAVKRLLAVSATRMPT